MTVLSGGLERKVKAAVRGSFQLEKLKPGAITFKSKTAERDVFHLYYETLTEYEILEIAKILAEVYRNFLKDIGERAWNDTPSERILNRQAELSGVLVGTIINLKASALHKLLLLTSVNLQLRSESLDLVMALAESKEDVCSRSEDIHDSRIVYNHLKNLYIFPGVAPNTLTPGDYIFGMNDDKRKSVDTASRIMAFLSGNSENLTLKENLDLDFAEAITTRRDLDSMENISTIQRMLVSDYQELAESMTAAELVPLISFFEDSTLDLKFPKEILRNRSRAMAKIGKLDSRQESILKYLSNAERNSVSSPSFITRIDNLLTYTHVFRLKTPALIYAALAEILVVKGEEKAFEVASELKHLPLIGSMTFKIYEATVNLIAEALKPESDDLPFGWFAQMSEHSWVLTTHIPAKEFESINLALSL